MEDGVAHADADGKAQEQDQRADGDAERGQRCAHLLLVEGGKGES